jgi:hypothetical protein
MADIDGGNFGNPAVPGGLQDPAFTIFRFTYFGADRVVSNLEWLIEIQDWHCPAARQQARERKRQNTETFFHTASLSCRKFIFTEILL